MIRNKKPKLIKAKMLLCIALFSITFSSCKKDFLEVVDKTRLLKEGYVVDLTTTNDFLNGIYSDLADYYTNGLNFPVPEVWADNMKMLKTTALRQTYNWSFSVNVGFSSGDPIVSWISYYRIIRDCDYVIEKANEFKNENESKAKNLKGQALAIRAMVHFILCNAFGQAYNFTTDASHYGVPYITSSDPEAPVSRQTVAEVYNFMIRDLGESLELLPKEAGVEKRKMNYQAAKALLARVYLFKENYEAAKNLSRQVLTDVPLLTAVDYPAKLYTDQDNEMLFWQPPGSTTGSLPTPGYSAGFIGYYASNPGGLYYTATNDIVQLLNENSTDKRRSWVKDTLGNWQIRKFPKSVAGPSATAQLNCNQSLIRSSEVCLIAAEAYAKLNMEDSARFFINQIRSRAGLSALFTTGAPLLDSIYKERRKEMCFDGLRMWDLKRWKMGVNRVDVFGAAPHIMPYPSNLAVSPIPLADVQLLGLPQNPGY